MSGLSDFKITDADVAQKGVVAAPDKLTGTAAQNKAIFDRLVREVVKARYNEMIDALETDISAYLGETEAERRAAEEQREKNENGYTDEEEVFHNGRVQNETARVAAETARCVWEAYDDTKTYVPGNKVSYQGSSYACIAQSTGNVPTDTTYWLVIAQKGLDGGVASFHSRTGEVVPQSGDYTAAMVGARASDWLPTPAEIGSAPALQADVAYYVDGANGDDTNAGTQAAPLKTIMAAVNKVPKNLNGHSATVYFAAGTYDETIAIQGFANGQLMLCPASAALTDMADVGHVVVSWCSAWIGLYAVNASGTNQYTGAFDIRMSQAVYLRNCKSTNSGTYGLLTIGATVYTLYVEVSNKTQAITAGAGAFVSGYAFSGSGNTIARAAGDGNSGPGLFLDFYSSITATTQNSLQAGGVLFVNGSQVTA